MPDEAPVTPAAECRITDPAAVQILWHPAKRVHLRPFIGRAAGLAEAAAMLGVRKPAMSYWIDRMLAVGLIREVGLRRQGRHPARLYRCVADRLRVSLKDAPLSSYEGLFDDVDERWHPLTRQALARSLARQAPFLDLKIEASHPGGMTTELLPQGDGAPADDFLYYRGRLWLAPAEAEQLRSELDALWSRYAALSDQAAKPQPTLLHLVCVPDRR